MPKDTLTLALIGITGGLVSAGLTTDSPILIGVSVSLSLYSIFRVFKR